MISIHQVIATCITQAVIMTLANFGYQYFTKMDWNVAVERSFFQIIAFAAVATALYFQSVKE